MTDLPEHQLTRQELLRRGVAAGSILTLPGFLAACGGGGTKGAAGTTTVSHTVPKTLTWSNWPL